ncbi:ABC transporter ATP-binding protein [Paenibacillus sp. J2TS4]|uniref:ABC transporter ATP-binding protein n=1 Tax=Paenibacillus sp. J2TS4 TaxID=2807194 RepID=UPI001B189B74|nr:ABC transporter ATP-binding protein [Paenibacillus sp. J2TS4]GIP34822.1 ABC transporter ATP-binding protein [Paenibacillus sp. J2TS4]
MNTVLNVSGVQKQYESGFALGPLSFVLDQGYIAAVVGPNGSGKSTLFKMLMNLVNPDQGSISLFDKGYPQDETDIKRRIGYVPELSEWDDSWKKARDTIHFYSHWFPGWDERRLQRLMDRFSLTSDLSFKGMSKGVQRKLSIVLAMAHDPDLLLLDEPSSGLDPFASRVMIDEIQRYMDSGTKSVLVATHIMEEVKKLADYVIFLSYGSLLGIFEKDTLLDEWKVIWAEQFPRQPKSIPGLVEITGTGPYQIITRSFEPTRHGLSEEGITIIKTEALELDEILYYLLHSQESSAIREGEKSNNEPIGN